MIADDNPIEADEVSCLFAPLLPAGAGRPVALAVSGGSDSTALMVLFAEWLRRAEAGATANVVLTVAELAKARGEDADELGARIAANAAAAFSLP